MAKVLRLSALPVSEQQAEDTVLAIRKGEPVRIPAFAGGEIPELATVATTGQYNDLKGKPTLGTASSMDASAFATAAQGAMAASALQPASIGQTIQAYSDVLAATTASFTTAYKTKLDGLDAALAGKVDKVAGKGLSANDYTNDERDKLAGIQAGAQVNPVPVDNLTTPDATQPLSANQGRVIKGLIDSINTLLQSDDSNLDELQEIVDYIKLNRAELDSLSIGSIAGLQTALDNKQPLSTVLSNTTASFTSDLLTKLTNIQAGAQVNPSSTDGVPEGGNLYFTNARAVTAIKSDADWRAADWNAAFSWGNHASAGYATTTAMQAYTYSKQQIDDKIDAGGSDSLTLAQAQAIALYF